ncbi:LOW QUALITY PROTEIN: disintegrin and metalloproteinase domain-containing protein 10 [Alosa alosa]|uniref:LOW QUALITY PROTEIN: disintegrin and metalloproteinase domain-containing protein 10 n=1 Tax=Alosa alosa TaxID=278164 RepID=UPI0020153047|nr:LOW QUALITY PROTEIN: disintegrin and metalloproteinase domain-containing protein 10 [Alosa alosa]
MAGDVLNIIHSWVLLLTCISGHSTGALGTIGQFIKYYEGLTYDRQVLHQSHQRVKREIVSHKQQLQLNFSAFQRDFNLVLRQDSEGFADNFKIDLGERDTVVDLSHVFSGKLEDEDQSSCHGSVLQGLFQGFITTANGTYHVEPLHSYTTNESEFHSIIYHEDDIDMSSLGNRVNGLCGSDLLAHLARSLRLEEEGQEESLMRSRRTTDDSKTTCLLHLQADHFYYRKFGSVEAVVAQVASYMRAVNDVYDKADFEGIKLINFKVKSLSVVTKEEPGNPMNGPFIGPEKLLSLYSETNWGNYCLSYLLTNRDYSGVLGLAWEGKTGNWGGICSKHTTLRNGRNSSLNTGLITVQNYGQYLPPRQIQLTFAHELGHSLGSPHDEGPACGSLGSEGGKGRYLMFPHASNEVQENNDKFSPCSLQRIGQTLWTKKDDCFVVSDQPICGNQIVEDGEECDVGHNDSDSCCYSSKESLAVQCRLKPNKLCSPSQGLCCSPSCDFKARGTPCEDESECEMKSECSGASPHCPAPRPKANMTVCSLGTRICLQGECSLSLCAKYGLGQCDCPGESMREKCHMCCQQINEPKTCASTTSSVLAKHFRGKRVALVAGAPCSGNQGYCDKFQICRLLDADGPIARLKNAFLHLDDFDDLGDWMVAHWWAILLAILTLSAVMAGTVLVFGRPLEIDDTE